jgi:hypothetical protein
VLNNFLEEINKAGLSYNIFTRNCQHFVEIMFKIATGQINVQTAIEKARSL